MGKSIQIHKFSHNPTTATISQYLGSILHIFKHTIEEQLPQKFEHSQRKASGGFAKHKRAESN
jgi:hypothetical protein